jgi:hypothetical protein
MKWYLDEYERMTRLIRGFAESPAQKLLSDLEELRQLAEPPGRRIDLIASRPLLPFSSSPCMPQARRPDLHS